MQSGGVLKVQNLKMSQMIKEHQKRLENVVDVKWNTADHCKMV